jgi:enoyl-CoA hydratase/carnithine racemase
MTAEEAKNYGLVDEVVQSRKEIPADTDAKAESKGTKNGKNDKNDPKSDSKKKD